MTACLNQEYFIKTIDDMTVNNQISPISCRENGVCFIRMPRMVVNYKSVNIDKGMGAHCCLMCCCVNVWMKCLEGKQSRRYPLVVRWCWRPRHTYLKYKGIKINENKRCLIDVVAFRLRSNQYSYEWKALVSSLNNADDGLYWVNGVGMVYLDHYHWEGFFLTFVVGSDLI